MPNGLEALQEIERLLRRADACLGSDGTFRLRTLLQMTLFEVCRGLEAQQRGEEGRPALEIEDDAPKR